MTQVAEALLIEVARCPVVRRCFDSTILAHPCSKIVTSQDGRQGFHLPEPWSGQIESAPILFVSTNPAINRNERFPTDCWSDEEIIAFFTNRFGHTNQRSHTWAEIIRLAEDFVGPDARPGIDWAITDVVRCKSSNRHGVKEALPECTSRYLRQTLDASGARIVVALGKYPRQKVAAHYSIPETLGVHGPILRNGEHRLIVLLGAPGANERRSLNVDELARVKAALALRA